VLTSVQAIKDLTSQLNDEVARFAPKAKFQFKPRAAKTADDGSAPTDDPREIRGNTVLPTADLTTTTQNEADGVGDLPSFSKNYNQELSRPGGGLGVRKPSFSAARDVNLTDHTGLHIILPSTAARATSSGSLTNLKDCIIDMSIPTAGSAAFLSLVLKDISRSLVVVGHVNGPAHITAVQDSIVVVVAKQVRIHECRNVDVYLHCTSRPIIEDCAGMRFAPIPGGYVRFHSSLRSRAAANGRTNRRAKTTWRARTSGTRSTTLSGSRRSTRQTGVSCRRATALPTRSGRRRCPAARASERRTS